MGCRAQRNNERMVAKMASIPDLASQIVTTLRTENVGHLEALLILATLVERARAFGMSDIAILRALGGEEIEREQANAI